MRRAYKFLLRPTRRQGHALGAMPRDHRVLYNAALQERRDAYRHPLRISIRYGDQSAQLREIRRGDPGGQGCWSFSSQQATLRRLDKTFAAFFRRVKAGRTPGYPRFKGAGHFDTVEFPKDGDGWGQFLGILGDKAERGGRRVVPVDARNTSRTCPTCGTWQRETASTKPASSANSADTPRTRTSLVR